MTLCKIELDTPDLDNLFSFRLLFQLKQVITRKISNNSSLNEYEIPQLEYREADLY